MTEEQAHNEEKFSQMLATIDPELWRIKQSLMLTNIDPQIVPFVIEAMHEVAFIHGSGSVEIFITQDEVKNIRANTNMAVGLRALLNK